MIRETAVTNPELVDLHSDCATNIERSCGVKQCQPGDNLLDVSDVARSQALVAEGGREQSHDVLVQTSGERG